MSRPSIWVVVPSIRPERADEFCAAWGPLLDRHGAILAVVWDGPSPAVQIINMRGGPVRKVTPDWDAYEHHGLVCRGTRAVCNLGFLEAAKHKPDYVLTLDDDVAPLPGTDPIQEHLDALNRRVSTSWMNTAMAEMATYDEAGNQTIWKGNWEDGPLYLRGVPYSVRDEAPVMVSHGVWVGTPDFDGQTQLRLQNEPNGVPYALPYYRGPVPAGVYIPFCGMNVMVRREVLPYFYYAPMGPDSGFPDLHRFDDIWMGARLREKCDRMNWAIYTGASTVLHTRASDPLKNAAAEKLGIEWNEYVYGNKEIDTLWPDGLGRYWNDYGRRADKFADVVSDMLK